MRVPRIPTLQRRRLSVPTTNVMDMTEAMELWDSHEVAAEAAACVRAERTAGCRLLVVAALWADHHPADGILHRFTDLAVAGEESARFGGDGTPEVAEFAPAELGLETGLSPNQARSLIADALDLRHRLPVLWARVQAGDVPAREARRVALRTRCLTIEQAKVVDRRVARYIGQLTWTRLENLLTAEILRVDRERVEQRTEDAKRFRSVRIGRGSEHGLTEVWMQLDTITALRLKAQLVQLAEVMMAHPDRLPAGVSSLGAQTKDEWEAVAVGMHPAVALQVLASVDQPDLFTDLEAHLRAAAQLTAGPPESRGIRAGRSASRRAGGRARVGGRAGACAGFRAWSRPGRVARGAAEGPGATDRSEEAAAEGRAARAHQCRGLGRVQSGCGPRGGPAGGHRPVLLSSVREWLGAGCRVRVLPVLDPGGIPAVDGYEIPARMAEVVLARSPGSVFPWSGITSRHGLDLDHTLPYTGPPGEGPAGQTCTENLVRWVAGSTGSRRSPGEGQTTGRGNVRLAVEVRPGHRHQSRRHSRPRHGEIRRRGLAERATPHSRPGGLTSLRPSTGSGRGSAGVRTRTDRARRTGAGSPGRVVGGEGEHVGELGRDHGRGFAHAVSGPGLDPGQGRSGPRWACCRAAVNLRLWEGTTRSSWSPVMIKVAG